METAQERAQRASQDNWIRHYQRLAAQAHKANDSSNLLTTYVSQSSSGSIVVALPSGQQLPLTSSAPSGVTAGDKLLTIKPSHSDTWLGTKP